MNGRIYDPLIGRFMSADPFIQAPTNLKSFNRYSYVWNNPLNATDPTGFTATNDEEEESVEARIPGSSEGGNKSSDNSGGGSGSKDVVVTTYQREAPKEKNDLGKVTLTTETLRLQDPEGIKKGPIEFEVSNRGPGNTAPKGGNAVQTPIAKTSTTTPSGTGNATIGPIPANFFTDSIVGQVVANLASPIALFTKNNVNPLTGRVENLNGDKKAVAVIGIVTLPFGGGSKMGAAPIKALAANGAIETGTLVERTFMTSKGPVDFLAEAVVQDGRLILKDSVLYGRTEQALTGMTRDIYRGFETMKDWAASLGFSSLEISGTRAANSTSATPGSTWSKVWDLTK